MSEKTTLELLRDTNPEEYVTESYSKSRERRYCLSSISSRIGTYASLFALPIGTAVIAADSTLMMSVLQRIGNPEVQYACQHSYDIDQICAGLKLNKSQLAVLLGISRQTVHNWHNGNTMKAEHTLVLRGIAEAITVLSSENVPLDMHLLKRNIANGQNLMAIIRNGGNVPEASRELVHIYESEKKQKIRLAQLHAGREVNMTALNFELTPANDVE